MVGRSHAPDEEVLGRHEGRQRGLAANGIYGDAPLGALPGQRQGVVAGGAACLFCFTYTIDCLVWNGMDGPMPIRILTDAQSNLT